LRLDLQYGSDELKIAIQGPDVSVQTIAGILSPWDITLTEMDEADIAIVHKEKPLETKKTVVIPSNSEASANYVGNTLWRTSRMVGERVSVPANSTVLTIAPEKLYIYKDLNKSDAEADHPLAVETNGNILLTFDVVTEYTRILSQTLNAKQSKKYRLLTGLPIPYTLAPRRLRALAVRQKSGGLQNLDMRDKLPLDALRFILVGAIETLSGEKLKRKTWNGKQSVTLITHDVDTFEGLRRSKAVKKLEQKYDLPSAWYIPSRHYALDVELVKELANHGEIGAHDTRHDGKLTSLPVKKIVNRLREAKRILGTSTNLPVVGFRAPLLAHNQNLMQSVKEAGYLYDTSIPTWEPKNPVTMTPGGIGTVFLTSINELAEIPVTLPQDHQMIHVAGMGLKQTVDTWISLMKMIQDLGGLCVLSIHPDYEFAYSQNFGIYEDILNIVSGNIKSHVCLPREVASRVFD
jgi:hypothetical protein